MLVLEGNGILDLLELGLNPRVGLITMGMEPGKSLETLLDVPVVNKPARRLRKNHDKGSEENSRNDLNSERRSPLAVVGGGESNVGTVGDPGCAQRTNAQHELLEGSDTSTDAGVSQLGLVQGNDHAKGADTKIS